MATQLTFAEAFSGWDSEIKPLVIAQFGADDTCALSESWNDYTDGLCKDGQLSDLQYHYCPAWDDSIPDCDAEFLLEAMGVQFAMLSIPSRPDGLMDDMPAGATHWRVMIKRGTKTMNDVFYSMGSAHTGVPSDTDVFHSLLSDTSDVDGSDFEEWAENLGMDTDSRRAEKMFKACQDTLLNLRLLFTDAELSDLREAFEDY